MVSYIKIHDWWRDDDFEVIANFQMTFYESLFLIGFIVLLRFGVTSRFIIGLPGIPANHCFAIFMSKGT